MRSFFLLSLLLNLFLLSCSLSHALQSNRHEKPGAHLWHGSNSFKRDTNVAFTYFVDGQGACGITNSPNDFIVAIGLGEYDGGAHCFEMITITVNGKTAQAQITDKCESCCLGCLDFSQGLFEYFAPLGEGEIYGSWSYNSDLSASTLPASTTSETPSAPATTAATTTSSSVATMSSSTSTVGPSPTLPTAVPSFIPQAPQVIAQVDLALLELGTLLQVSAALQNSC